MNSIHIYCNEMLMYLVFGLFPGFDNPDRLFIEDESMFSTSCDCVSLLSRHHTDLLPECFFRLGVCILA